MSYDPDRIIINIPPAPMTSDIRAIELNGQLIPFVPDFCSLIRVELNAETGAPELTMKYQGWPPREEKYRAQE